MLRNINNKSINFCRQHINQTENATLAILTEAEHQGNSTILNTPGEGLPEAARKAFDKIRKDFWKKYVASFV